MSGQTPSALGILGLSSTIAECNCVVVDPTYQHVFDDLIKSFDNIGYGSDSLRYCPCCGHKVAGWVVKAALSVNLEMIE